MNKKECERNFFLKSFIKNNEGAFELLAYYILFMMLVLIWFWGMVK